MNFELLRDEHGNPHHVHIDDGFMRSSRKFNPEEDGWMEDQLDPRDFEAIRIGRQTEMLVAEINALRRENWHLQKSNKQWMGAAGFGERA